MMFLGATTLSIMTLSIMTFIRMTFSRMTLSIMTLSIMTIAIKGLFVTLGINDTQHNKTVIMRSAIMLSVTLYLL